MSRTRRLRKARRDGAIREYLDTLPDLRITLHVLPWAWRMYSWKDDVTSSWHGQFGPVVVEWWGN